MWVGRSEQTQKALIGPREVTQAGGTRLNSQIVHERCAKLIEVGVLRKEAMFLIDRFLPVALNFAVDNLSLIVGLNGVRPEFPKIFRDLVAEKKLRPAPGADQTWKLIQIWVAISHPMPKEGFRI
jgi:hypothetical protein